MTQGLHIGIDLGGTKILGVIMDGSSREIGRVQRPTPHNDYPKTIKEISDIISRLETDAGANNSSVGVGIPGSLSPHTGLMQNANSTWLNGQPFGEDLEAILRRPIRLTNDANCFTLSEATDGAAQDAHCVFGVILGTGCGGGIVVDGLVLNGAQSISGEWGHTPLPAPRHDELPGLDCWCGRTNCLETWISGPGLSADHMRRTGNNLTAQDIASLAGGHDDNAQTTLERHLDRLARGLGIVVNLIDPDVIVLGGGLSNMNHLYQQLPDALQPHIFSDHPKIRIVAPRYGAASGVRGAAWLGAGRYTTHKIAQ